MGANALSHLNPNPNPILNPNPKPNPNPVQKCISAPKILIVVVLQRFLNI